MAAAVVADSHRQLDQIRGIKTIQDPATGKHIGVSATRRFAAGEEVEYVHGVVQPAQDHPHLMAEATQLRPLVVPWVRPDAFLLLIGFGAFYRRAAAAGLPSNLTAVAASYEPNAEAISLRALRDIEAGEELIFPDIKQPL
jgi:hypothetical protein